MYVCTIKNIPIYNIHVFCVVCVCVCVYIYIIVILVMLCNLLHILKVDILK